MFLCGYEKLQVVNIFLGHDADAVFREKFYRLVDALVRDAEDHICPLILACREGIGVFKVDVTLFEYVENMVKRARLVGYLDGEHRRHRRDAAPYRGR